jgi:hypothetical protein
MDRLLPRVLSGMSVTALLLGSLAAPSLAVAGSSASGIAKDTRTVTLGGSISPVTGSFTASPSTATGISDDEFLGDEDDADGADGDQDVANITDRSLSNGHGGQAAPTTNGKQAKSNPSFVNGFEGLNHYQQRYARGGNQFSLEPPDQGMCVGNGYVVEAVNDVFNVYDTSGNSLLPDNTAANVVSGAPRDVHHAVDLNSFYGYPPAVNRTTGVRGQFVTDPSCLYDAATNRFFLVVLTLETFPNGAFTTVNHLDIAVSQTGSPTGNWNIYRVDVTNDGSNIGGGNPGPYLGDYPHIGADANGFYMTTNAYPWCCNGFGGSQMYAISKAALAAGAPAVTVYHFDTTGMVNAPSDAGSTQPGFTVWPAQSPNAGSGNTEYFMSSNAADEATHPAAGTGGNYMASTIVVWSLKGTNSLATATLSATVVASEPYALPPKAKQMGTGTAPGLTEPQGHCLNDETTVTIAGVGCWRLLVTAAAHARGPEVISDLDANDTRMQQVTYANGKLWGALDTAINPGAGPRAGIAWFIVNPSSMKVDMQGYLGADGYDFTYPAIGVTSSGRGIMAFTATGDTIYPSAAYASIDAKAGVGPWNVVPGGAGAAAQDGFSGYRQQSNPRRPRWGDYGAAAVDGNNIWVASEYVATPCSYVQWGGPFFAGGSGDNLLGTCGYQETSGAWTGGRTALGNWSTRISEFTP